MDTSHTPGPWKVSECRFGITVDSLDLGVICEMEAVGAHARADARLIAAAPDLLKAIKWVLEIRQQERDGHATSEDLLDAIADLDDAHLAATGERYPDDASCD